LIRFEANDLLKKWFGIQRIKEIELMELLRNQLLLKRGAAAFSAN